MITDTILGLLIPRQEMPKCCDECLLEFHNECILLTKGTYEADNDHDASRLPDCPLCEISIPQIEINGAGAAETTIITSNRVVYRLTDRVISIDKDIVDAYEETVCPISDTWLEAMIRAMGDSGTDTVISREIELDMAREIEEYGGNA